MIESYVLGLASEDERREFEKICSQYPELLEARIAFEKSLEKQAMENSIKPPAFLREKFLEHIGDDSVSRPATIKMPGWWRIAVAASLLLLVASIFWNISLLNKNKKLNADVTAKTLKLEEMEKDMLVLQQNPRIKMASMKGMEASPQSYATVYWDTTSHDVYLLANNLPEPASDKQYQLWAIFNNKPVDLGVFDIKKEKLLIQARNAQGAEAFAITLEKKGGSPEGPKGVMYVMGKL